MKQWFLRLALNTKKMLMKRTPLKITARSVERRADRKKLNAKRYPLKITAHSVERIADRKKLNAIRYPLSAKMGFTILEVLVASFITLLVITGLFGSYLLIQRNWSGGAKQTRIQGQARNALKEISLEIKEAKTISGGGDEIFFTTLQNKQKGFCYVPGQETLYYYSGADWASRTDERVIANYVIRQPGEEIFTVTGRRVITKIRARDTLSQDGYQGIDLQSSAYHRNVP